MPKDSSARNVRRLRRELRIAQSSVRQSFSNAISVANRTRIEHAVAAKKISSLKSRNNSACQNVRLLHQMFLKQQTVIRKLQSELRDKYKKNPALSNPTADAARSMIVLSEQLCAHCLGTRHILKTKKNIRFSVECKACTK
jgi:hypothetical protein